MRAGVTCVPLSLGFRGVGAGLSLAAVTRQQGTLDSAELTVTDVDCLLIIGQCGVHFFGVICSQHEPRAMAGVASKIIASIEATSLERHVMVLGKSYWGRPSGAVIEITGTCVRPRLWLFGRPIVAGWVWSGDLMKG